MMVSPTSHTLSRLTKNGINIKQFKKHVNYDPNGKSLVFTHYFFANIIPNRSK